MLWRIKNWIRRCRLRVAGVIAPGGDIKTILKACDSSWTERQLVRCVEYAETYRKKITSGTDYSLTHLITTTARLRSKDVEFSIGDGQLIKSIQDSNPVLNILKGLKTKPPYSGGTVIDKPVEYKDKI